jgi:predicted small secreted protein
VTLNVATCRDKFFLCLPLHSPKTTKKNLVGTAIAFVYRAGRTVRLTGNTLQFVAQLFGDSLVACSWRFFMRSILFPALFVLLVCSMAACSSSNMMGGQGDRITPLSGDTSATTPEHECPPGEIYFWSRCRQQRGIIIDQKPQPQGIIVDQKLNVPGIIIDQKKPLPPPPPPPPPSSN